MSNVDEEEKEPIIGKIARILDEYTVVLNVGKEHGVKKGMMFLIYQEGEEICDPDSKESLGMLEIPKGEVEIVGVQNKSSIAKSSETETVPLFYIPTFTRRIRVRLSVKPEDIEPMETVEKTVRVGDKVKQII